MSTTIEMDLDVECYPSSEEQQHHPQQDVTQQQEDHTTAARMEVVPFGKPHPLLIDHVIQEVVQYLIADHEDETVLRSRLVCQIWDKVATQTLRLHSNRTIYFGKYFRNAECLLEFLHYLKTVTSPDHFPVGKFYLCEDIFKSCHLPKVQSFFIDCANLLTSLTIRLDAQSDLKVSELNFARLNLPYLKCLVLDDRRLSENVATIYDNINVEQDENNEAAMTCLLAALVKCSPNLRSLTVIYPPSSIFDDEETASTRRTASEKNVAKMLVNHSPRHLNSLSLDIHLNDKVLLTLSEIPVCLAELQLSLRESVFSKESLHKLLDAHKETLRSLSFSSMGMKSHFEIVFPVLPKLNSLELHSWDSQIQGVTLSKFAYQSHFPSLKSLVLQTWAENPSWIQFFPAAYYGVVESMDSLKLPQNFMYPAMIQNLSWLYPNLRKMDLHFSKETILIIQRVFTHFSEHLEDLKIRDSLPREKFEFCLDSLFTGLPRSVCDKILRNRLFDPDPEKNHLLKLKQQPSLLNLRNLKRLDIEDMLRHDTYITDVTGFLVLLQMPSLCYLNMGRSQIEDECLWLLAKKYPRNMERELESPKPPPRRMPRSASNLILTRTPSSLMNAYNYCASLDLVNSCAIC